MSKELVIGSNRHETKVAVLEDDQLVEVYFQRANEYSLAGSIHKGRVTRVLPGMQSAFVDLGLERDTFLYVSDFFEEHEDIDVAEEKPIRRDRDRADRNQGRGGERQPPPERLAQQAVAEVRESVAIPSETERDPGYAEGESGIVVAENAASGAAVSAPEVGLQEQRTDDRGFRNDGRNRRGRRRRQRGRGFPDSKYAQPGTATSAPVRFVGPETDEPEETAAAEVIILPGESLAKYRGRVPGTDTQTFAEGPERDQPDISSEDTTLEPPTDPEEQMAIEEEAEELELAEKVLSHHNNETPGEIEEKIEEVKQDQSLSEPAETMADVHGEELFSKASVTVLPASPEPLEAPEPSSSDAGLFLVEEIEDLEGGEPEESAETPDAEEFDIFEPEEAQETPAEVKAAETVAEDRPAEGSQPRTASVRDQGGRAMHRVSRRMRRRRGGNRFGQGGESAGPSSGAVAGAAVAYEPENPRETPEERTVERPDRGTPSIAELLKAGQEIIVQIAKEPLGQKGARITSHIALPGRYVVFMPSVSHLGVSRKVASDEERQRLKRILQANRVGTTGGFIVRTAGEGVPEDEIAADMNYLYSLWLDIRQKAEKKPAPALLHYDLDIVQRILRDQVTDEFKSIWVDDEDLYENVVTFMQRFQPALVNRVKLYTRSAPIFDAFNITQELEKALRPKVWLKSGGYIVINQTEALVAIDINTGKYVGKSNRLEDTIVKTNTEAVKEIVRQIRLRDLGGIIVVDFIDMDERKNRQKVMQALEDAMRADKAPYKILQFNDFGLVAITRKRVKQSLERTLCSPCPYCEGAGYVKSVQTVISEILVEAQKLSKALEGHDVVLRVHPEVAKVLKASTNNYLDELEDILGRPVLVTGDPTVHLEKFDLG
ncbi:MAG TPA: Rne/Rng family ribonuclease [Bryobacteraceae bacterium]|nr:Rne/Rng family ribonuclease [Bryobacteraceae bacterium]